MIDLRSLEYAELEKFIVDAGEAKYRAKQIFSWLSFGVDSFDEMTNISKATREKLSKISYISTLKIRVDIFVYLKYN